MPTSKTTMTGETQLQLVMSYAAELELEVDRLRRRDQFIQQEAQEHLQQIAQACGATGGSQDPSNALLAVSRVGEMFAELLRDMHEPPGYHPAFDQVVAIAVRPLAEQVFRFQQRISGASNAVLRLDLEPDYIDWFPARLRHILENLISNALRYRDSSKGEVRVGLALRMLTEGYELRFTDNGIGIPRGKATDMLELFYRSAPNRVAGLGVGLAVVKLLVQQCCGTISVASEENEGTNVTVVLPRYDLKDHVD